MLEFFSVRANSMHLLAQITYFQAAYQLNAPKTFCKRIAQKVSKMLIPWGWKAPSRRGKVIDKMKLLSRIVRL